MFLKIINTKMWNIHFVVRNNINFIIEMGSGDVNSRIDE